MFTDPLPEKFPLAILTFLLAKQGEYERKYESFVMWFEAPGSIILGVQIERQEKKLDSLPVAAINTRISDKELVFSIFKWWSISSLMNIISS